MAEEVKVAKATAYRGMQTKVVQLPSGFHFRIKKLSPMGLADLIGVYGDALPGERRELTPDERAKIQKVGREKLSEILKIVLPESVVEPKVSLNPENENVLNLNEIATDDVFALLDEITEFSGLATTDKEEREKFREK